jgi:8-oxo-dGTP pyrophosphatase MutT (NUDIX family)
MGWPVLTAKGCFAAIRGLGIRPWIKAFEPVPIDSFLVSAKGSERQDYERFGPKVFAAGYQNPATHEPFLGFRAVCKPYALVFAVVEGYVVVTAEWKHGNDRITIVPVAGALGSRPDAKLTLAQQMKAVAKREWREETGTDVELVLPLGPSDGMFSESRKMDARYFPFLGMIKQPIRKFAAKLDRHETLVVVAFPLAEWLALIETPELWDANPDFGLEYCARDVTYMALRKMGRLKFV